MRTDTRRRRAAAWGHDVRGTWQNVELDEGAHEHDFGA